jgi:hypothetical protein
VGDDFRSNRRPDTAVSFAARVGATVAANLSWRERYHQTPEIKEVNTGRRLEGCAIWHLAVMRISKAELHDRIRAIFG